MAKRKNNDIFTPDQDSAAATKAGGWQGDVRNVLRDDFGMEMPVETVPVPSCGICYPVDSPLHGKEVLEVRTMTAREEDILTNRNYIKKKTVITELIKSCLIDKTINPNDMLIGDRNAIMIALRVTGYGPEYRVDIDCPACNERSRQDFDLSNLPIDRLKEQPVANGINLFEFTLPVTQKKVRFRYLTGRDELEISQTMERRKKQGWADSSAITQRLATQIVAVDAIEDRNKILKFISAMPARDSLKLRKHMDKNEPGIEMKGYMECPHCGEESEVRLPMGASFFWPDSD